MAQLSAYEKSEIKALRFEKEEWILALERLVTAGNGIFHAVTEEIRGPEEIVGVLDQLLGRQDLAKETQKLVSQLASGEARYYELVEDQWIPLPEGAFVDLRPMSRRNAEELAATLASLRAIKSAALAQKKKLDAQDSAPVQGEDRSPGQGGADLSHRLDLLAQRIEAIAQRLDAIEARVTAVEGGLVRSDAEAKTQLPDEATRSAPHRHDQASPMRQDGGAPQSPDPKHEDSAARQTSESEAAASHVSVPVTLPGVAQIEAEQEDLFPETEDEATGPSSQDAPPPPIVVLPAVEDLRETLEMLVGDELPLSPRDPNTSIATKEAYLAPFVDREGAIVGAVLADRAAMVSLGGSLLLLPQNTWRERLHEEPSADILDAMSEIANNIAPLINGDERNSHVRATSFEPLEKGLPTWLDQAARVALGESELDGTLTVLAAPEAIPQDDTESPSQ